MSIAFSKVEPELENLSDRAKIAIAARCARRVEPLACHLTREQREALRAAIDGLEAYAKGEKFQKIPAEALRTLQQLEYTDVGAEAAYVALRASEGVILREEEKFQEEKFRASVRDVLSKEDLSKEEKWHLNQVERLREAYSAHPEAAPWSTYNAILASAIASYPRAFRASQSEINRETTGNITPGLLSSFVRSSIEHSVAASAAGAAAKGGRASTEALRAALAAASSDIDTANRLSRASYIDPSESGPLGPLWPEYKPEFSVPKSKFNKYYSCFISYCTKDQAFADQLYADLQMQDVRCWFAPEDLKIGDKIRYAIDESICGYDKLLLLLSKHSVISPWVEHEVETALARERDQGQIVLFPIRLDNAIMDIKMGWAAHIKNTRNIGDFCQWTTNDAYRKAFNRLLHDLKAAEPK